MKILALNPAKPPRKTTRKKTKRTAEPAPKKERKTMTTTKKRRGGASRGRGRITKPAFIMTTSPASPARKARRRRRNPPMLGGTSGRSGLLGPVESAAKNAIPMLVGAMAAKLVQRRWGNGTPEAENWTWKDYLFAALGTLGASLAAKHVFRAGGALQQRIMEGGLVMIGFKLITQELVPMSETATKWLGEDGATYLPGDTYQSAMGEEFVLGAGGEWEPTAPGLLGSVVTAPGPLGSVVTAPGPLGEAEAWGPNNLWS